MSDYVRVGDFEGCLERFNNAYKNWKEHWFEGLKTIYNNCTEWAKKYILDPIAKTVIKIINVIKPTYKRRSKYEDMIEYHGCMPINEKREQFYLLKMYNSKGEFVCSKVGTTTRATNKRMTEHLQSKTYKKLDINKIIVDRVWDCGKCEAEGYESFFRAYYIAKHSKAFCKNDRFFGIEFDLEEADRLFEQYTNMIVA